MPYGMSKNMIHNYEYPFLLFCEHFFSLQSPNRLLSIILLSSILDHARQETLQATLSGIKKLHSVKVDGLNLKSGDQNLISSHSVMHSI